MNSWILSATGSRQLAGNHIVREGVSNDLPVDDPCRAWIVNRVLHDRSTQRIGGEHTSGQRFAEVAVPHPFGGHRLKQSGSCLDLPELLEGVKEERPVASLVNAGNRHRPAEAGAEIVSAVRWLDQLSGSVIGKRNARAEFFVHVIFEQAAAQRVACRTSRSG